MKNTRTLGGIAVLVLAFASPALAKGTDHEGQHGATQGQESSQNPQGSQGQSEQGQKSAQSQAPRGESQQSARTDTQSQSGWSGLSKSQVESLQQALQQRGHYEGNIDGIAGPNTRAALQSFQQQNGITASGQLNDRTMNALGVDLERQPVAGNQMSERQPGVGVESDQSSGRSAATRQSGMNPGQGETQHELTALTEEQARELQVRLQERGFYQGEIDGKIGPATRAALSRFFQRQSQLVAQGKLSESALNAFGMDANEIQPVRGTDSPE